MQRPGLLFMPHLPSPGVEAERDPAESPARGPWIAFVPFPNLTGGRGLSCHLRTEH